MVNPERISPEDNLLLDRYLIMTLPEGRLDV